MILHYFSDNRTPLRNDCKEGWVLLNRLQSHRSHPVMFHFLAT